MKVDIIDRANRISIMLQDLEVMVTAFKSLFDDEEANASRIKAMKADILGNRKDFITISYHDEEAFWIAYHDFKGLHNDDEYELLVGCELIREWDRRHCLDDSVIKNDFINQVW